MSSSPAFTLLEVLVTLTIMSVVAYLTTLAYPVMRESEALVHARQQIIAALRTGQVQALNETRSPDCLRQVDDTPLAAKRCSDIGIVVQGKELITFADTHDNDRYDSEDFQVSSATLPRLVSAPSAASLLIEATPPNVTLWHNGTLVPAGSTAPLALRVGRRNVTLSVSSYGLIE